MLKQMTLKAGVVMATLLVGNAAWADTCRQDDGHCRTGSVNAGADRVIGYRCTINVPRAIDAGNCKIIEVATGRFVLDDNFRGDTSNRSVRTPTTGAYYCVVERVGLNRGTVYCNIE